MKGKEIITEGGARTHTAAGPKRSRTVRAITALCQLSYFGIYQGAKYSFALPIELTAKFLACNIGVEPMT